MKKNSMSIILLLLLLSFSACTTIPDGTKETETKEKPQYTSILKAQYPYYETAEEIVDKADLVFSGTVENSSCIFDNDMAYTVYEIKLEKMYKGDVQYNENVQEDTVYLRCMGGIWEDTEYILEGAPEILIGEKYLFLAATFENAYPTLLNLDQAIYHLDEADTGTLENGNITLSQILETLE